MKKTIALIALVLVLALGMASVAGAAQEQIMKYMVDTAIFNAP